MPPRLYCRKERARRAAWYVSRARCEGLLILRRVWRRAFFGVAMKRWQPFHQ